jgi:ketosteroid isomerase-like protein
MSSALQARSQENPATSETWPGFFEWQASGAVFEIESLAVTAGTDVAFANATPPASAPDPGATR